MKSINEKISEFETKLGNVETLETKKRRVTEISW